MLCTFCNTARLDNEAPCPRCGAPSPLLGQAQHATPGVYTPAPQWANSGTLYSPMQVNNQGQPVSGPLFQPQQPQPQTEQQAPSLLPVPYQGQQALFQTSSNALIPLPAQNINVMPPALPEEAVYVPPMYTNPRPIIPHYRVISGLLSVLIVTLLLCTGAGYYARASGKLSSLGHLVGFVPPTNLKPSSAATLPDPPTTQVTGPAYTIISSATTTASINSQGVATERTPFLSPTSPSTLPIAFTHPKHRGSWSSTGILMERSTSQALPRRSAPVSTAARRWHMLYPPRAKWNSIGTTSWQSACTLLCAKRW